MQPSQIKYDISDALCYDFSSIIPLLMVAFTQKIIKENKAPKFYLWLSLHLLQENVPFMTVWDISDCSCINLENKPRKKNGWYFITNPFYLKAELKENKK